MYSSKSTQPTMPSIMETLPFEIKRMIYTECVKTRALGLLCTNKQIYQEFISLLRNEFVLGLHIDPADQSSKVKFINPDNSPWGVHDCAVENASSSHTVSTGFDAMPTDSFKEIRILIEARLMWTTLTSSFGDCCNATRSSKLCYLDRQIPPRRPEVKPT